MQNQNQHSLRYVGLNLPLMKNKRGMKKTRGCFFVNTVYSGVQLSGPDTSTRPIKFLLFSFFLSQCRFLYESCAK